MSRFYFDFRDGERLARDEEGLEFADVGAAQAEAVHALADLSRDAIRGSATSALWRSIAFEVRDAAGPVLQSMFTFEVRHKPATTGPQAPLVA